MNKIERMKLFATVDIYPVISSEFCNGRSPLFVLEQVAKGGAGIVQLREKSMTKGELLELAKEYRKICDKYSMLLIINDHVDIALEVTADGVHLGQEDMSLKKAVKMAPELILGVSTHNKKEALGACSEGASYINIGPIFSTQTKELSMDALGPSMIKEISPLINVPFTVMGGIKKHHIKELNAHGATKIAMVTEITMAENIKERVVELRKEFSDL